MELSLQGDEQFQAFRGLLIPSLQDEITLREIAPKLPWKSFYVLSAVNRAWLRAVQTRQVFEARAQSNSPPEPLVLVTHARDPAADKRAEKKRTRRGPHIHVPEWIALASLRHHSCNFLPPIPNLGDRKFPRRCECVSLNGKLYVLGGQTRDDPVSRKVYVLDLAGCKGTWTECASDRPKMGLLMRDNPREDLCLWRHSVLQPCSSVRSV
ncbi:unnamed protein product [Calypogeia fissa]